MRSPATANAAVLERFGRGVRVVDVALPEPGPDEVLVAVDYGGICGTDLHLEAGHLPVPLPVVLGHEGLGRVIALGANVSSERAHFLQPGRRVMWASSISCGRCWHCRVAREPTLCEHRRTYGVNRQLTDATGPTGAWADHILLDARSTLVPVPDEVDSLSAMALACAGPTVLHALDERRPIRLGETVVVQGAGPVGLAAMMYARLAGARLLIAVGAPDERLAVIRDLGLADLVLDFRARSADELIAAVVDATPSGRGADLVIECTGVPSAVDEGLRMCRRGADYLIIGQYTDAGAAQINPHTIVHRQLTVTGSWAFSGAHLEAYVESLPALVTRWPLAKLVTSFPLEAATEAMAAVAAGTVLKAVLASQPA